jgi:hypothetical protein
MERVVRTDWILCRTFTFYIDMDCIERKENGMLDSSEMVC